MRIALIDTDKPGYEYSLAPVATLLLEDGHEIMAVYSGAVGPSDPRVHFGSCSWALFDHDPIIRFNPDRIIVFNGSHKAIFAATQWLKAHYRTVYMEHGWLPQQEYNYIDAQGTGARSLLFDTWAHRVGTSERIQETMARLQKVYRPEPHGLSLPENYILVPLQLERDTSILYDSPCFKSMASLVGFVRRHFYDQHIVVKTHPMDETSYAFEGVTIVRERVPINSLIATARAVVGINSTALIEALVHLKPVGALGLNVASRKGVFYEERDMFFRPRGLLDFKPEQSSVERTLDLLFHAQYPRAKPTLDYLNKILG